MSTVSAKNTHASPQLWWRIASLLMLVMTLVLILITFLNYANYRKNFLELNLTRHLIMAKDLRQTIESGMNIGISPAENGHLRPIMQTLLQAHSDTRYIAIVNENGILLKLGEVPSSALASWKEQINQVADDAYWHSRDAQNFQLGMPFSNNFNLRVGNVVIGYDRATIEAALHHMQIQLLQDLLGVVVLCASILFGGCYWLTRQLMHELAQAEQVLTKPLPLLPTKDHSNDEVTQGIQHFVIQSEQVGHQLTQIEMSLHAGGRT